MSHAQLVTAVTGWLEIAVLLAYEIQPQIQRIGRSLGAFTGPPGIL